MFGVNTYGFKWFCWRNGRLCSGLLTKTSTCKEPHWPASSMVVTGGILGKGTLIAAGHGGGDSGTLRGWCRCLLARLRGVWRIQMSHGFRPVGSWTCFFVEYFFVKTNGLEFVWKDSPLWYSGSQQWWRSMDQNVQGNLPHQLQAIYLSIYLSFYIYINMQDSDMVYYI